MVGKSARVASRTVIGAPVIAYRASPSGGVHDGGERRRLPSRARRVDLHAVPELARHLLVLLVQALAVVGELAAPHEGAVAEADLPEPVGIGQRLARGADEVGLAALEDALRLLER